MRTTHKRFFYIMMLAVFLLLTGWTVMGVKRYRVMQRALQELQADNQADSVFTSDSAAQALVRYFDHFWHHRNDRMLAYYLLGRAHADMGEAPQAIEAYQTAAEVADTTDADCDFRLLRNIYGQMAEVFHAQNLPEDEIEAQKVFNKYSWIIGDTLFAIVGYQALEGPYYLLNEFDRVLIVDDEASKLFLELEYHELAARALMTPIYLYIERHEYDKAKKYIDIVRTEAGIFNEDGSLKKGHEKFYYTLGLYYDGIHQLDSAEFYYRRVLSAGEQEAGYKGLLSVYSKRGIADSIAKFAPLYADANDASHDSQRTAEVHKTASLYNYNRHLKNAQKESLKARRRLMVINGCVIIILAMLMIGYALYAKSIRRERDREHALNVLRSKYIEISTALENSIAERIEQKEHTERLGQNLQDLVEQKAQLELLVSTLQEKNKNGSYYANDIVQAILSCAIYRKQTPSAKLFHQLHHLFSETFPDFLSFVSKTHSLTDYEWYVCILTDLGLGNNDMSFLIGQTAQRVNNIKRQVNHNLFGEDVSSTLQANLRSVIHAA